MIIVNGSCVFRNSKRTYQASNLYDGLENERPCAEPGKEESARSPSLPLAAPRPSAPASVSTPPRGSVTRTHAHAHAHTYTHTHARWDGREVVGSHRKDRRPRRVRWRATVEAAEPGGLERGFPPASVTDRLSGQTGEAAAVLRILPRATQSAAVCSHHGDSAEARVSPPDRGGN